MDLVRPLGLALLAALLPGCRHVAPAPLDPAGRAAAFEARSLDAPALRDFVADALGAPPPAWPPERFDERTLAAVALYWQPSVAAAHARVHGATAAIRSAGARPNPTLAITPERGSNPGAGVPPWIAALQIDWPIETAGKRERRIERARAVEQSAQLAARAEAWSVRHRVATALLDVVAARRRGEWLAREAATARALAALYEARVAQGAASAADALPFRLAQLESEQALAAERAGEAERLAVLAQAVGVPVRAFDGVALVERARQGDPLATATRAAALEHALFERADVLGALADYAVAEASLRLELAKQWPDLHLGPGYQFDQGQSKWSVGLSIELPVLDRNQGPIGEAEASREAAAIAFDAAQAQGIAEVEQALARRDGAVAQREQLANAAGERRRQLDHLQDALRLGAADAAAVRVAELEWLRAERARGDADVAWLQAIADLEAAVQPASSGGMP